MADTDKPVQATTACTRCRGSGAEQVGSPESWSWEKCDACGGTGRQAVEATTPPVSARDYWFQRYEREAAEAKRLRAVMREARSLLDRRMGDTDPANPDDPLLRAAQLLAEAVT